MKQLFFLNTIKTHPILLKKFSMLFLIILVLGTLMGTVQGQAVYVDKVDYMPGDIININGYAWRPGEVVSVVLTENYLNPEGKLITSKSFTCDYQGKFSGILYTVVEANLGAFFQLKATGSITNHVCTTVFHDAGGDYSIDYSAYDPQYYNRLSVSTLFPDGIPAGGLTGNMTSPLALGGSAGSTMHTHTVESLSPQFLGLGQIVSFEFYISADAGSACPNDKISFGGSWSTLTQNSEDFGFDPNYKVIAAFVDPSVEATFQDGGSPASARILSNDVINNNIEAMFEVSGLDPGDKFPVEIWLVLKSSIAASVGSNVPTGAINGLTLGTCETGEAVRMGNQTVPLLQAGDFFTTDVDVLITKSDSQDPVAIGAEFYYTLTVTNNGPSVANNINISDILNNNFNVDVDAILFSHNISTGFVDDPAWSHSFDLATHTLTLTKLSIDLGETIYIKVPVIWVPPYSGTKTSGSAGPGAAGSSCTGDLVNKVSITTISDDINSANDSYCQPTNVMCSTVSANAGPDKVLNCSVTSLSLDATLIQGLDYSWVASNGGNIVSGANTAAPTVDEPGTYTLTITDPASGCYATDVALVTQNISAPVAEAGTPKVLNCTVTSIALAGSSSTEGATFSWAGPGIVSGGSTLTPTVNVAGTYILTVTGPNGCQSTDNVLVTLDSSAPVAEAGIPKVLNCTVTSISLAGSSSTEGATFSWAGPGIVSGGSTLTPTVNVAGTYVLTVTGPNGCQSTDNVLVNLDNELPNVNAGADKVLSCTVTSVTLNGSSTNQGASFLWTGPGIVSGGNTLTPVINATGSYILTVTASNGCIAADAIEVTMNIDKEPPVIECPAPITVACASAIPDPVLPRATDNCGIDKVEWLGDVKSNETCEQRFTITRTFRATDVNGFTSECTQIITVNDNIAPALKPGAVFPAGQADMNLCKASIPAGPSVEEIKALYADNCGGEVVVFKSGAPTGDDCSWSVTYTYIVKDMCRNYVVGVPTVTYSGGDKTPPSLKPGASFPAGQTSMNLCKASIPAGPSVDEIKALYMDNCGGNITVINLGGQVTGDDCNWSVTYTYRVKDACYNEILPRPTITYSGGDKIAPVLKPGATFPVGQTGMNLCKSSVPAGPSLEEIKALYMDNCGGSITVINLGGLISGDDSNWSVTYTYRIKDACYNEVLPRPTITFSGSDMTAPVLKPGATLPAGQTGINSPMSSIPEGPSAEEIKDLYMDNCGGEITVTGLTRTVTGDDSSWSVVYTYSVVDGNNNEVLPGPAITYSGSSKTPPTILPDNGETEYTIEGCDMEFRLPKPTVTGECSGEIILKAYVGSTEIDLSSYKFENEGVTIVTFIATDACGNSSTSAITVNRLECIDKSHCTYTQDWYGSQGSTNCVFVDGTYQKLDALSMMTTAFTDLTSVTFGDKSAQKYFDLMKESISGTAAYEGIFQMLPGGGTPAALLGPSSSMDPIGRTAGRWVNIPRSTELSNRGTIMNSLLSHTIALFFNLENDGSLGEFELRGRYMVTAKSTECGSETTVPNSSTYVEFPLSVLDYFSSNSLTGTIDDLYKLANDVLGGIVTSVSASDVEKAVIAVNKGFDGCRVLIEFSQNVPSVPKATAGATDIRTSISASKDINEVTLTVYPNPFAQFVKFEIEMLLDSHVRIDIFSTSGTLLDVLLNESLSQGDSRTVEFDGSKYPHSSFLYRITTNGTLLNGTILKTK